MRVKDSNILNFPGHMCDECGVCMMGIELLDKKPGRDALSPEGGRATTNLLDVADVASNKCIRTIVYSIARDKT